MKPKPDCKFCRGTGTVTDWVDYGSTRVPMETPCDCATGDYPEVERCSACKENAEFVMNDEWEWRSECCGAKATPVEAA